MAKPKTESITLPSWLDPELFEAYVEMRDEIKSPMTTRAKKMLLKRLEGFWKEGHNITSMLERAIVGNWKNVYLTKEDEHIKKPDRNQFNPNIDAIPKVNRLDPSKKKEIFELGRKLAKKNGVYKHV